MLDIYGIVGSTTQERHRNESRRNTRFSKGYPYIVFHKSAFVGNDCHNECMQRLVGAITLPTSAVLVLHHTFWKATFAGYIVHINSRRLINSLTVRCRNRSASSRLVRCEGRFFLYFLQYKAVANARNKHRPSPRTLDRSKFDALIRDITTSDIVGAI